MLFMAVITGCFSVLHTGIAFAYSLQTLCLVQVLTEFTMGLVDTGMQIKCSNFGTPGITKFVFAI